MAWWQVKEWGNAACQSFFPFLSERQRHSASVLCWQELADGCLLSEPICRVQEKRLDQGLDLNALNNRSLTEGGQWIITSIQVFYFFTIFLLIISTCHVVCKWVQTYSLPCIFFVSNFKQLYNSFFSFLLFKDVYLVLLSYCSVSIIE